jgi:primary-amine oxidase
MRRGRRLVVSHTATVSNYDYGFYWYFYLDGTISFECKATGLSSLHFFELNFSTVLLFSLSMNFLYFILNLFEWFILPYLFLFVFFCSGVLSTNFLPAGESPRGHGVLVSPQVNAQIHQHFFVLRLNTMVDGTRNSIYEVNVVPAPVSNLCLISVCE